MVRCPKCETEVRREAVKCPMCGTPLRVRSLGQSQEEHADPIVDPLLDRFERDEIAAWCPECLNEFREDQKRCRPCGRELRHETQSAYLAEIRFRPVRNLGERLRSGPPDVPRDLVRVKVARSLADAACVLRELRHLALEAWAGSDALDPFDDPGSIGIYVRARDREAGEYFARGFRSPDPLELPPGVPPPAAAGSAAAAREWIRFGKYREALRIAERLPAGGEADEVRVQALLEAGRRREAADFAALAARRASGAGRGRLLALEAVARSLGHDGTPFGAGSDPAAARTVAAEAVAAAPRLVPAGKVLAEILDAAGDRPALLKELHRLGRLCPNLLSRDGPFRSMRDASESGALPVTPRTLPSGGGAPR